MTNRATSLLAALGVLACVFAAPAAATTWYVAANGGSSNPGTSAAPFLTVQQGVNAAKAGDTIVVENGTYAASCGGGMAVTISNSGTASAPITLEAQNYGQAVLNGQLSCHSYLDFSGSASWWIVKGFSIENDLWGGIWINSGSGAGSHTIIENNIIHNIGNVTGQTASTGIAGLYIDATAADMVVNGNIFYNNGRISVLTGTHDHNIYTHAPNILIENNVFYNLMNGWHIQTADGFSGTIAYNTFYGPDPYPGTYGQVMLWGADGSVTVENNIFLDANTAGIITYAVTFSGACTFSHNMTYTSGQTISIASPAPSGCTQSGNYLNVNPLLTNPAGGNFTLQAGSPAIGAGIAVSGVTGDFNGTPRPPYDLGAFVHSGGATAGGGATGSTGGAATTGGATPPPTGKATFTISGVTVSGVTNNGATISWTTSSGTTGTVSYGRSTTYGSTATDGTTLSTTHTATLRNLTSGTLFHYRVNGTDGSGDTAASPDGTFKTTGRVSVMPAP